MEWVYLCSSITAKENEKGFSRLIGLRLPIRQAYVVYSANFLAPLEIQVPATPDIARVSAMSGLPEHICFCSVKLSVEVEIQVPSSERAWRLCHLISSKSSPIG